MRSEERTGMKVNPARIYFENGQQLSSERGPEQTDVRGRERERERTMDLAISPQTIRRAAETVPPHMRRKFLINRLS